MAIINPMFRMLHRLMPVPQLMPEWLRRSVVNPVIYSMRKAGHPLADIKETVNAVVGPLKWLQYGRDLSRVTGMAEKLEMLQGWDVDRVFTKASMVETILKSNRSYLLSGVATIYDSETRSLTTKHISFYDDVRRTPAEYEEYFKDLYLSDRKYSHLTLIGIDFTSVLHDTRRPY